MIDRVPLAERLTENPTEHTAWCANAEAMIAVLDYCPVCGVMGRRTIREQELRNAAATAVRRSESADLRVRLFRGKDAAIMGRAAEEAWEEAKAALLELEHLLGEERMGRILG